MRTPPKPAKFIDTGRIELFLKWYRKQPFSTKTSILTAVLVVLVLPFAVNNLKNAIRERSNASESEVVTCESGRITDGFSLADLDLTKYATSGAIIQGSDELLATVSAGQVADSWSGINTLNTYQGDFYTEVDLIRLNALPEEATGSQHLYIAEGDQRAYIKRISNLDGTEMLESNAMIDGVWITPQTAAISKNQPVRVKIERVGTQIKTYYKSGTNAYTLLGNFSTKLTEPVTIYLVTWPQDDNTAASGIFDNFSIRCIESNSTAIAPTPTPTPDLRCHDESPRGTADLYQINFTNTKATLYFAPAKQPFNKYTIEYGESGQFQHSLMIDSSNTSGAVTATINALKPSTTYTFRVQALNGCMPGGWSNSLSGTTARTSTQSRTAYKDGQGKIKDTTPTRSIIEPTTKPTSKTSIKPVVTPKPIVEDAPITKNPEYTPPESLGLWQRIVTWFGSLFK